MSDDGFNQIQTVLFETVAQLIRFSGHRVVQSFSFADAIDSKLVERSVFTSSNDSLDESSKRKYDTTCPMVCICVPVLICQTAVLDMRVCVCSNTFVYMVELPTTCIERCRCHGHSPVTKQQTYTCMCRLTHRKCQFCASRYTAKHFSQPSFPYLLLLLSIFFFFNSLNE